MKFRSRMALGSIPLLVGLLASVGCEEKNQFQPPPPPEVTVAYPTEQPVIDYLDFTGTTQAVESVEIRARVNGYLQSIHFKDGAYVKKGDLLFVIEKAPFVNELAAAKASLKKAEAAAKLADAELRRIRPLVKKGAMPEADLDAKEAQYATAQADMASSQAAIDVANLNLSYTQVEAPISGRISRRMVDVGNLVQASTTMLTTIESYQPIYAYFSLSESDLLAYMDMRRKANLPSIEKDPPKLMLGLTEGDNYPYEGVLDFASIGVDPSTGTAQRRGVFANEDRSLIPGLFVRIRSPIGEAKPRVVVPERAVSVDQRGEFLLVVNGENKVEYRPVKLGITVEGKRVVQEGVTVKDRIVVNGLQRAVPGRPVNPMTEAEAAAALAAKAEAEASPSGSPAPKGDSSKPTTDTTSPAGDTTSPATGGTTPATAATTSKSS